MTLAACPACSSLSEYREEGAFVCRPELTRGRATGKVFISGCCGFSRKFNESFDTAESAEAAWNFYRSEAARIQAERGFSRLADNLVKLDEREAFIFAKRVESEILVPPLVPEVPSAPLVPSLPPAPRRVPQLERRAPASVTEIYNKQPSLL